jgi:hypothetical protein
MVRSAVSTDGKKAEAKADTVQLDDAGEGSTGPSSVNLGDMAGLKRGLDDNAIIVSDSSTLSATYVMSWKSELPKFLVSHGWSVTSDGT